jgi:hypothetical protein
MAAKADKPHWKCEDDGQYLHLKTTRRGVDIYISVKLDDEGVIVDAWNYPAGEVVGTMAVEYGDFDSNPDED